MNVNKIIGIGNRDYRAYREAYRKGCFNGAFYYALEIENNIIPLVKTDYNWDLLGMRMTGHMDYSIIFIHHNVDMDATYWWLKKYKDIILVVSQKHVYEWAVENGFRAILLPLSIDTTYVAQFKCKKKFGACYAGNRWKFKREDEDKNIPEGVDFPPANLPREELLKFIAPYKKCYAIGRCALEAKVLGCEVLPFYWRYPDPDHWVVLDNEDAAKLLQKALDMIKEDGHSVNCYDFPEYRVLK